MSGGEDQSQLAELFGERPQIQLRETEGDLEGHAISAEVLVEVEGHAMTLRLPNAADAAALRRALAVGAVTATLVGAGLIASLKSPVQAPANVQQAPRVQSQEVPAQALRADEAEALREQSYANSQAVSQSTESVGNTVVPAPALRADEAEALREQSYANSQAVSQSTESVGNTVVPAPAGRPDEAEALGEQSYAEQDE